MPNRSRFVLVAAIAVALGLPVVSAADEGSGELKARLRGFTEVPAVSTTGRGELLLRFDDDDDDDDDADGGEVTSIAYTLRYRDLEGAVTLAAHIHLGQPGVNGGVSVFLCGDSAPPCPPTEGTVTGTIEAADVIGPAGQGIAAGEFEELIRAMRAQVTYVNVHTDKHPTGEIRGAIRYSEQVPAAWQVQGPKGVVNRLATTPSASESRRAQRLAEVVETELAA